MRRRREIESLARELFRQAKDLLRAVGDLVPAELAAGDGDPMDGAPLGAVAERLDESLLCFDLLQQELGLPSGVGPRYRRHPSLSGAQAPVAFATTPPAPAGSPRNEPT